MRDSKNLRSKVEFSTLEGGGGGGGTEENPGRSRCRGGGQRLSWQGCAQRVVCSPVHTSRPGRVKQQLFPGTHAFRSLKYSTYDGRFFVLMWCGWAGFAIEVYACTRGGELPPSSALRIWGAFQSGVPALRALN